MRCENCGFANKTEARFCVECGQPLVQRAANPRPAKPRAAWGWYIALVSLSLALVALFVVVVATRGSDDPSSTSVVEEPSGTTPSNSGVSAGYVAEKTSTEKSSASGGASKQRGSTSTASRTESRDPQEVAVEFMRTWYDDWSLDGTSRRDNDKSVAERCRPLVDDSSSVYGELGGAGLGKAAYSSSKDAATCVVKEPQVVSSDGNSYRISLWYVGDQESNWSGEGDGVTYDWLVGNRLHEVSWDVTIGDTGKVSGLELVARGPYILTGSVRVHEEEVNGNRITIASLMLDEPLHFKFEYKGTNEGEAQDIAIGEEFARYDGGRITVECEDLQGAYHDASYYNVDALVRGTAQLVEVVEEPRREEPEEQTLEPQRDTDFAEVVSLDGCELGVPVGWRGKVVEGVRYDDVTLEWNGFYMLFIRQCTPADFLTYDRQVATLQLYDGTEVIMRSGCDHIFEAEIPYGSGKGLIIYLHAYSKDMRYFMGTSEERCQEYFALQAAATDLTTDDDPDEVAKLCLRTCVENLRFTE